MRKMLNLNINRVCNPVSSSPLYKEIINTIINGVRSNLIDVYNEKT